MSKLVEHKEIIHIGTEIVLMAGLSYYFHSKTKKLSSRLEELEKQLAENKATIANHAQVIQNIMGHIDSLNQKLTSAHIPTHERKKGKELQPRRDTKSAKKSPKKPIIIVPQPKIVEIEELDELTSSEEEDSDVDAEIEEELRELGSSKA